MNSFKEKESKIERLSDILSKCNSQGFNTQSLKCTFCSNNRGHNLLTKIQFVPMIFRIVTQGKLTGWLGNTGPKAIGICRCGDLAFVPNRVLNFSGNFLKNYHCVCVCVGGGGGGVNTDRIYYTIFSKVPCLPLCSNCSPCEDNPIQINCQSIGSKA